MTTVQNAYHFNGEGNFPYFLWDKSKPKGDKKNVLVGEFFTDAKVESAVLKQCDKEFYDRETRVYRLLQENPHSSFFTMLFADVFEDRLHCIVLPCLPFGDLHYIFHVQRIKPTPREYMKITAGMVSGIEELGRLGIIHGDLKLDNILSDREWNVKIADFGISYILREDEKCREYWLFNYHFRSPVIALGLPYDTAVNVWALGSILFELVTYNYACFIDNSYRLMNAKWNILLAATESQKDEAKRRHKEMVNYLDEVSCKRLVESCIELIGAHAPKSMQTKLYPKNVHIYPHKRGWRQMFAQFSKGKLDPIERVISHCFNWEPTPIGKINEEFLESIKEGSA